MSYFPIELDKERTFKYGMKAFNLIEKKLKKPMSKIDMDHLTMEETAIVLWAGLQHEDKNLTPNKIIDLVDEHTNLMSVTLEMSKAMTLAMVGEEGLKEMERELEEIEEVEKGKND